MKQNSNINLNNTHIEVDEKVEIKICIICFILLISKERLEEWFNEKIVKTNEPWKLYMNAH